MLILLCFIEPPSTDGAPRLVTTVADIKRQLLVNH